MRFWHFVLATTTGATLWNSFLLACGFKLRENWEMVQTYRHHFDGLIIGMSPLAPLLGEDCRRKYGKSKRA